MSDLYHKGIYLAISQIGSLGWLVYACARMMMAGGGVKCKIKGISMRYRMITMKIIIKAFCTYLASFASYVSIDHVCFR